MFFLKLYSLVYALVAMAMKVANILARKLRRVALTAISCLGGCSLNTTCFFVRNLARELPFKIPCFWACFVHILLLKTLK